MRRISFLAVLAAVVLIAVPIVQFGPLRPSIVGAHTPGGVPTVHPPSPPTYDYDTVTPGTQPPTSPLLANPTARTVEMLRLIVQAIVPWAQLQAILPPGFTATEFPAPGSGQALMPLVFTFQQRCERLGVPPGFGTTAGLFPLHTAYNTELNRNEILVLAGELSEASNVDCFNAVFGPGSARLADVEVEIEERGDQRRLKFEVEDEAIGLKVKAEATSPSAINARGHGDPVLAEPLFLSPLPVRFLNGMSANPALLFSQMTEFGAVPTAEAKLKLRLGRSRGRSHDDTLGELHLPGGSVEIVGFGPNVIFSRWLEFFLK